MEIEQNKYVGPISTIMRLVTQKDGNLSTYFDIIDESENGINNSSIKQILIDNHTEANRGLIPGHLPLEYVFGFFRSFKKNSKSLGFELDLRTSNRKQDILYTTIEDEDVNVTINSFSFFIPQLKQSTETQYIFIEAISIKLTIKINIGMLLKNFLNNKYLQEHLCIYLNILILIQVVIISLKL